MRRVRSPLTPLSECAYCQAGRVNQSKRWVGGRRWSSLMSGLRSGGDGKAREGNEVTFAGLALARWCCGRYPPKYLVEREDSHKQLIDFITGAFVGQCVESKTMRSHPAYPTGPNVAPCFVAARSKLGKANLHSVQHLDSMS